MKYSAPFINTNPLPIHPVYLQQPPSPATYVCMTCTEEIWLNDPFLPFVDRNLLPVSAGQTHHSQHKVKTMLLHDRCKEAGPVNWHEAADRCLGFVRVALLVCR